jgi:hypothetical protein
MAKPIKDILSEYEAELKEKKTSKTLPGSKVMNAVINVVKSPDFYQTVFGAAAGVGGVGTAISGAATSVKKLGEGGDQVKQDIANGSGAALGVVGELVGAVSGGLKQADDSAATGMAGATQIAAAAEGVGIKLEGLSDTMQDKGGNFKKAALMARQVARSAFAVSEEAIRYRRLNRTKVNFNYWVKIELSKRRLVQEEIGIYSLLEKDKFGSDAHQKIFSEMDDAKFSLDEIKEKLVGKEGSEQLDSLKKFRKRMNDAMVKLMEIKKKDPMLTHDEKHVLNQNKKLLEFIKDTSPDALPSAVDEKKIKCLQLRLEQQHAVRLLARYDERIEKRIIHRVATKGDEPEVKRKLEKRLALNEKLETAVKDFIPKKFAASIKTDFKALKEKVENPDLITDKEKSEASQFDRTYDHRHGEKIKTGKKTLAAKALLVGCFAVGLVGIIVGFALIGNPIALPVVATIAVLAIALGFAANKVKPGVFVGVNKNISDFISKIKHHSRIQNRVKLMTAEFKEAEAQPKEALVEREVKVEQAEVAVSSKAKSSTFFQPSIEGALSQLTEVEKKVEMISEKILDSDRKSSAPDALASAIIELEAQRVILEDVKKQFKQENIRPTQPIQSKMDEIGEKLLDLRRLATPKTPKITRAP